LAEIFEALAKIAQTGCWGVALVVIFLWSRSNDKKNAQDIEAKKLELAQKQKEQESLLEVIKGNTEALTKLTSLVESQSKVLDKMLDKQSDLFTNVQVQMAKLE
jgi:septal ring factor EnvC (AmiA/AmiB activator)